jgi:hypothetical protein
VYKVWHYAPPIFPLLDTQYHLDFSVNLCATLPSLLLTMYWSFDTRAPRLRGERTPEEVAPEPRLPGERTPEETALEKGNDFEALQRYRLNWWQTEDNESPDCSTFTAFFRGEESLRKICQTEIALKKQPNTASQIHALNELRQNAWFLERELRYFRSELLESPSALERAFKQWRSNPRWYMHPFLVEDCINRGGCCSRGCECCLSSERETSSVGELGIGHCTVECGCCCDARGFELTVEQKNDIERRFGFLDMDDENMFSDYRYQHRLFCASVWGLLRNASYDEYGYEYLKRAESPIFQSRPLKCDGTRNVVHSETLLEDSLAEESDSTVIVN